MSNQIFHRDFKFPYVSDVIQERSIKHHARLGDHPDLLLPHC
nr:unnamed protein product [Callosobruchus chinensis]